MAWRRRDDSARTCREILISTQVVRGFAVDALRAASDTELNTYLLQLVQALRYDEKDEKGRSPLASFLSERAARSVAVANFVWWYLKVGAEDATDEQSCATYRVYRGRSVTV